MDAGLIHGCSSVHGFRDRTGILYQARSNLNQTHFAGTQLWIATYISLWNGSAWLDLWNETMIARGFSSTRVRLTVSTLTLVWYFLSIYSYIDKFYYMLYLCPRNHWNVISSLPLSLFYAWRCCPTLSLGELGGGLYAAVRWFNWINEKLSMVFPSSWIYSNSKIASKYRGWWAKHPSFEPACV